MEVQSNLSVVFGYTSRIITTLALLTVLAVVVDYITILWQRRKLPPGPVPWPIIGNTFSLPPQKPWIYIEQLSKDFNSPVLTFWIGRRPTVFLNDSWSAHDLLTKRASIYASRPHQVVLGDLFNGHTNMATMAYGERWRLHRRLTHSATSPPQIRSYRSFQENEARVASLGILQSGEQYEAHFERYAASVISTIGTGRRIAGLNDTVTRQVLEVTAEFGEKIVIGKHFPMILETFPIIARFPPLRAAFQSANSGPNLYYDLTAQASQRDAPCFFKSIWEAREKYQLSDAEVTSLTGNLFGAGVETSTYALLTFVLAACCFPEAQERARAELSAVCGEERSPSHEDLESLPYVRAFVAEVFRWRSPAILGGQPHAPVADDYYKGWLIPQGTSVTGNLWAIHRNEVDFPEPDQFCPERHLPGHPLCRPFPNEQQRYMTFGWGRRACSGQALAEQGMLLQVARLLWAFQIESVIDGRSGEKIKLDIFDYTNGFNIRPKPFACNFTPRSEEIRMILIKEGEQALKDLSQYDSPATT